MNQPIISHLRFFTPMKANSALVLVRPIVREIMDKHKRLVRVQGEIEEVDRRLPDANEEDTGIYERISDELYQEMNVILDRIAHIIEELHAVGCIFKDFQVGIVDFPTHFAGRDVYLCWQFGENEITHWHEMDEGFTGRNMIDSDFLTNSSGAETILA